MILDRYHAKIGNTCLLSSVSNLLNFHGINIKDYELFFCGDGMTLTYNFTQNSVSQIKLHYYTDKLLSVFFQKYNSDIYIGCDLDDSKIIDRINKKIPLIIMVNTKHLTYSVAYKKLQKNRQHYVTIYGYDDNFYYIADCFIPNLNQIELYQGKILKETLLSSNNLELGQYYNFKLDLPALSSYKESISDCFTNNVKRYQNIDYFKMVDFANKLKEFNNYFSEEDLKNKLSELYFAIQYNGIINSRRFILLYISENYNNSKLIRLLNYIIQEWSLISLNLLKTSFYPNSKNFARLSDRMNYILQQEYQIFTQINNL